MSKKQMIDKCNDSGGNGGFPSLFLLRFCGGVFTVRQESRDKLEVKQRGCAYIRCYPEYLHAPL
jgi:hypothetical protein